MSGPFVAQFSSGDCYVCGMYFREGDVLRYDRNGHLQHDECSDRVHAPAEAQPVLFDIEAARAARIA
jgi:hypothetical protein